MKQYNPGEWLGGLKVQSQRAGAYYNYIALVFSAAAAYGQLRQWFPWLTFTMVIITLVIMFVIVMMLDYVFVVKSENLYNTRQVYRHGSPATIDLQILKHNLKRLMDERGIDWEDKI